MTEQELTHLYEMRMNSIAPFIRFHAASMSRMDGHEQKDLEQYARLHVWKTLQQRPDSKVAYLKVAAKNKMIEEQRRGRSVDRNPYCRMVSTQVFRLDHSMTPNGQPLLDVLPAERWTSLEDQVINKISLERFLDHLSAAEELYVRFKMEDEWSDREILSKTQWTHGRLKDMKRQIRDKMELVFSC